ncbi:MAG: tripartite tricarboxylate transporter substrate binding protein [Polaromonas sp.]|nr:tripartite tricarboxylate transporter substrate binding protein [Polaromonas sp.]
MPALVLASVFFLPGLGKAQEAGYPTKPIKLLVGATAGGPSDVIARLMAQKLSSALGQQVVVENRAGAGATLAAAMVAKSPPDGYTLFLTPSAHSLAPSMYEKLSFDPVADFESVGEFGIVPLVMIVNKSFPANSLKDFVSLARAKPNSINFGSGGNGTSQHLAGELLMSITGIQMSHVPYKGSALAMTDLLGGQIQVIIEPLLSALPQIESGRVKALVVTAPRRASSLPNVPTTKEAGMPELDVSAWYGLLAPAKTPEGVISRLNAALNSTLSEPATKASLQAQGVEVVFGPPKLFTDLIVSEIARWKPIIKKSGIKAD